MKPRKRRNSFAGSRQVEVLLSKTPSAAKFSTGLPSRRPSISSMTPLTASSVSELTLLVPDKIANRRHTYHKAKSLSIDNSFTDIQVPSPPKTISRRNSAVASANTLHLPTITETFASDDSEKEDDNLTWVLGGDLVVSTSSRRPSLAKASVLLDSSDKLHRQPSRLESIIQNDQSSEEDVANTPDSCYTDVPSGHEDEGTSNASSSRRHSGESRRGSTSDQQSFVKEIDTNSPLTVVTDHGIAERLGQHLTVLRPRSKSFSE